MAAVVAAIPLSVIAGIRWLAPTCSHCELARVAGTSDCLCGGRSATPVLTTPDCWPVGTMIRTFQKCSLSGRSRAGGKAAHGSYEEVAQNPDVDLVYVNPIHTTHKDTTALMLEHGKHVLCEKPIAVSVGPDPDLHPHLFSEPDPTPSTLTLTPARVLALLLAQI